MSRKIFILVNANATEFDGKPAILASGTSCILAANGTGEHIVASWDELTNEGFDLSALATSDYNAHRIHYFKRRAQARKAKRAIEVSGKFPGAALRIAELGEYDRSIKPVSSWKVEARVSKRTAYVISDGDWFVYATGHATRNAARKDVASARSVQQQRLTENKTATQYDYRVVPVYA